MNAVYELRDSHAISSPFAGGPWNPNHQHGAAPAALIARAAERIPTREPMLVTRITVDLLRPVPVAPLEIKTEVIREGRKIQLCAVQLLANGVEVVRASVLKIRVAEMQLPETVQDALVTLPGPDEGRVPKENVGDQFTTGVAMRIVKGGFRIPGPAALWIKMDRPIIDGEPVTPLMRAVITADYCNGTSSMLDFKSWTFINGDLNINFARMPVGEWILLDAESYVGPNGAGIAFARLADSQGYFGRAAQSIVIEPRG